MPLDAKDLWLAVIIASQPWLVDAMAMAMGYLLGSIPFGYIFSRFAGLGDIRKIGSGNIGATNVLRTGRKGLAFITLVCDAVKGFLPVFLCRSFVGSDAALFAALGAFAGHLFPVWLNFRGGKGVATYIGILLGLYWQAGIFFCAIWLCIALISRYSSLSALIAATLTPLLLLMQGSYRVFALVLVLSALLIARHHNNIRNLIAGHERKIGERPS